MTKDQFIEQVIQEHEERFGRLDENRLGCIIQSLEASYYLGQSHLTLDIAEVLSPFVAEMFTPQGPRPAPPNPETWEGRVHKNNEENEIIERFRPKKERSVTRRI